MKSISTEDYLSAIYKYRNPDGEIKAVEIAERLSISNAAVTDMLKKLSRDGYVNYKKYKGITLTPNGESYAKNMVRRHRIWEVFLHQVVGLPWDKVHGEAEKLEHSSSDELVNRLEEILDFPEYDPHGDPIPGKDGKIPKAKKAVPLSSLQPNEKAEVIRVNDFDSELLNYLTRLGIELDKEITVKERLEFDNSMLIKINRKEMNISKKVAANIFVKCVNGKK